MSGGKSRVTMEEATPDAVMGQTREDTKGALPELGFDKCISERRTEQ